MCKTRPFCTFFGGIPNEIPNQYRVGARYDVEGMTRDDGENLHFYRAFEFLKEAEVVLEVVTEVVDPPFEHSDALQAHSECKS